MSSDDTQPRSLSGRLLLWLAHSLYRHRRWYYYPQLILAGLAVFYTITNLTFLTSRNDLVGGDKEYHRNYLRFRAEFPVQDDLVVVVESKDFEKNRQFVERLAARLEHTNIFTNIFYKGDLKLLGRKALLFVPEPELQELYKTLSEYQPVLNQFTRATNLVSLFNLVNTQFRTAKREDTPENQALVKALPALQRIIEQSGDALNRMGNPPSPGINALFEGSKEAQNAMYITFDEGRIYLLTAQAVTDPLNAAAVEVMRRMISETQLEVPGLNVGLTGEPVLEVDEMTQSSKDSTWATIVSFVVVALIFIYGYHETGRPLKAVGCLVIGLCYTMGYTTLVVGHLNILTITFVPILIGLAIDFGVHLITRYEEELRAGNTERYALEKAVVNTGLGIFTGAFTTAGAFFAMAIADFRGIREMGLICGGGMLVCLVPMMTMLPVLLLRGKQNVLDQELGPVLGVKAAVEVDRRARLENIWLRRPWIVFALTATITLLALIPARKVRFDYNLLHMQSAGLPAVLFQDKLIKSSTRSVLFGVLVADSLIEATNLIAAVTNLPSVDSVESMIPYLVEDQTAKLRIVGQIKDLASRIRFYPIDTNPVDIPQLDGTLYSLRSYCALAANEAKKDDPEIYQELIKLRDSISALRRQLLLGDRHSASLKLAGFQRALFEDVRETFHALKNQDDRGGMRPEDLPEALRSRFIGIHGKFLIQVYPKYDVWNRAEQEQFIKELRTLDRDVTGTPVQLYEYTGLLKQSFQDAGLYSLIAISILVFIHFRKVTAVILSLIPVGVGFLWMMAVMGLFGISFNPANIMTLPLTVGIGVTNGIHILNRFAEEQHPSILAKSTGKAVLISGLTTIAGFGSLIIAQHRGIRSLGEIMATGVTTCMVVGLMFLPALLNLLMRYNWTIKKTQRDNARSTLGREEPR